MNLEEPNKRFLAFGHDQYYPNGGLCDMIGTFDTVEESIAFLKTSNREYKDLYDRIKGVSIDLELYGI